MACGQCRQGPRTLGSIAQVQAALEAAGVRGQVADDLVDGARADHDTHGAEPEAIAFSRARQYANGLSEAGCQLGADAIMTIEGELTRYFMSPINGQ